MYFNVGQWPYFHSHGHNMSEQGGLVHTCLNPHIKIIYVDYCHLSYRIETSNLGSRPNNDKYGEKDEKEAFQLNLYPITNHGSCKSQFRIWPLWRPYFPNPLFIVCTIRSTNPSTLGWSHEVVRWSINIFSHNSWNSPQNYVPWSVRISTRAPNLLNILSKNAYVVISLLRSKNGTNSNHLEKCSIITKTYQFIEVSISMGWQYPCPIIGKDRRWSVGVDAWTWSHTIHLKINCWTCNCTPRHQYCVWSKLCVRRTPKWPNSSWTCLIRISHCSRQGTTFTCPFAHIRRKESPSHLNRLALCTTWSFSLGVNPIRISFACKYAMTNASS